MNIGWKKLKEKDMLEMAKVMTRHVKFLHPEIVKAIVSDNEKKYNVMSDIMKAHGINSNLYLWRNSSTAFPGIRRHQGKKEEALKHQSI